MNQNTRPLAVLIFVVMLSAFTLNYYHQQAVTATTDESEAVRKVLLSQVDAWNRGSIEEFMEGYSKTDTLSFFSGKNDTRGWQQMLDRYRSRYQGEGREMGRLSFTDLEIEILSTTSAYVRGKWNLNLRDGAVGGLFTLILKKQDGKWRVVHDHTSG